MDRLAARARAATALLAATLALGAMAAERSRTARAEFQRLHPCPATGKARGPCKGYVVDHIKALQCGGDDRPANMQWQTLSEAKAKDRIELIGCARKRSPPP